MRRLIAALLGLLLAAAPSGATKVLLRVAVSPLSLRASAWGGIGCVRTGGPYDFDLRVADTTQGGTATLTHVFAPSGTAPPCWFQSGSPFPYLFWVTAPLSSGVTISGNLDHQIGCRESATALNAGLDVQVWKWDGRRGGLVALIQDSADSGECPTTANVVTIAAAAPTSTVMAVGDRIVIIPNVRNVGGGWGGNDTRTIEIRVNGGVGTAGDSFVNFADTLSFGSDVAPSTMEWQLSWNPVRDLFVSRARTFLRPRPLVASDLWIQEGMEG